MSNLIGYLEQKNAAGTIPLPDEHKPLVNLNIFGPKSKFCHMLLKQTIPNILNTNNKNLDQSPTSSASFPFNSILSSDYLVMVMLKTANYVESEKISAQK